MLQLKNITKDYILGDNTVPALKGVSINFRKNEFVSILGQSGCGKTTLLNIIGGLDQYTSGDLIINGKSTKQFKDRDWDTYRNHSIGFVFQNYNLIPHQTVLSNVELALTLSGVSKSERKKKAIEALDKVGLKDQIYKKPNQMSGGQMQRVAIARALVNNPDILLADEPTGALDSETSIQIMNLLKEISNDKLIIMVTHNPEIANEYSTRIINLLDGNIINDSNPYSDDQIQNDEASAKTPNESRVKHKKTSMSFFTAMSLSLNNLMTKKTRTLLTSFAGSIGIIGIALILAVSTGVQKYIDTVQRDTLTSYPISIQSENLEISDLIESITDEKNDSNLDGSAEEKRNSKRVYENAIMAELINSLNSIETTKNNLKDLKKYIENNTEFLDSLLTVQYSYDLDFDIYTKDPENVIMKSDVIEFIQESMGTKDFYEQQSSNPMFSSSMKSSESQFNIWSEILPDKNGKAINPLIKDQYELLYGKYPEKYNEVVLITDENNRINNLVVYSLGLMSDEEAKNSMNNMQNGDKVTIEDERNWSFKEICNKKFKVILPIDKYQKQSNGTYVDLSSTETGITYLYDNSELELSIVGILRPSKDSISTSMKNSIGYTNALSKHIIEKISKSSIVKEQIKNKEKDILTGLDFKTEENSNISDDEKVTQIKAYFKTLSTNEKATIYTEIASVPPADYLANAKQQMLSSMTKDQINEMLMTAISQQMNVDKEKVQEYVEKMSDEDIKTYIDKIIEVQITKNYADSISEQLSSLPVSQLALMFDSAEYSTKEYAELYDKYMPNNLSDSTYEDNLKILGYVNINEPTTINLYTSTFENKDRIAELIEEYNNGVEKENKISYTDYVALIMSSITTIINAISYVLIAFVAISLVVSSIMIGIITYISVLERTKEIGILRAIGASKKDISRVFNAETLLVGFVAGAIGIGMSLLFILIINIILHSLTNIAALNAILPATGAITLIAISMFLTFISGLIPSGIAAKKDPVIALRSE